MTRIKVDADRCDAWVDGRLVRLTPIQFAIVTALAENAGHYMNAREMRKRVPAWAEYTVPAVSEVLRATVWYIRQEVGPDIIRSKPGFGYLIEADDVERCPTCGRVT